jgi:alkylation response protein AidB-like acyl-CoA dehydrogenase
MDFSFTPEQEALRDLARKILEDHVTHDTLKATERGAEWFDRRVWAALGGARLLGLALPEDVGGEGLGLLELCLLLEQVGRTVAPVPVWPTLVLGALPLAEFGTREQRRRWLPGVAAGETILTAALAESGEGDPAAPATTARPDGRRWRLDGAKTCVPAAHLAACVLVPARTAAGAVGVFVVEPQVAGVALERQVATNLEPQFRMTLAGAPAELLGESADGAGVVSWMVARAVVGLCALQLGVTDRALRMTAEYTVQREQFGVPIASFQAVHQRAADAYIDVEAIRLTLWQAAWRLATGQPAGAEVAVAKFWASEVAHRVVYAAQHLHGGIGVDIDYPLHRYYLWAKAIELTLGSGTRQLERLGADLARRPPDPERLGGGRT